MADNSTAKTSSAKMGTEVDRMVTMAKNQRKQFERRWYDNNFFDDGFHFRYISRDTGKIVDLGNRNRISSPTRAIPKASRQIRGVANLLLQPNYTPVIYPEKVSKVNYPDPNDYDLAKKAAKEVAQSIGHWINEEWDKQALKEKLIEMVILASKHGVSYLQVWADEQDEKIRTEVYDAFDIFLMGHLTSIYDSPFIIKSIPTLISKIKSDERFDKDARNRLSPDNKYATSEVKEAYMRQRFGSGMTADGAATILLNEAFVKESVCKDNKDEIVKSIGKAIKDYKDGSNIIRHTFSAGGETLLDEYLDLPEYPFVDLRMEPGPIYQVPLIERFIPANKSLDMIMSRIERYANTMITGTWLKRKGENFQINNVPGGQVIEYSAQPPIQGQMASLPGFWFQYVQLLEKQIEEQGASTSALGSLPPGVKSGVAIESVKATEFMNLKISSDMLKDAVTRISQRFIDIASDYFITPQTLVLLERGEPKYLDIIGKQGVKARKMAKIDDPRDAIIINKEYKVKIEVESGLGFTMDGKKDTMQQISQYVIGLAQQGLVGPDVVRKITEKFLETFQFGSTQEFMDALDKEAEQGGINEDQLDKMKIALAETLKDTGAVGKEAEDRQIQTGKISTLEALQDAAK